MTDCQKPISDYRACFLIPCYNHGKTVAAVVDSLRDFEITIILVDDGSETDTKQVLKALGAQEEITLVTLPNNRGKGGAVIAGLREANQQGYSHCIQIDADGQHDVQALPKLMAASKAQPNRLISGRPIYDESVPKSRLYGRYMTHIWVWIETLSLSIKDSMCGFRAYPVAPTVALLNRCRIGKRMDFDIEILVRLYWQGVDIDFIDTRVIYPEGGISHFDSFRDNLRISQMHTKLFFGMLPRIPALLRRKKPAKQHWSKQTEKGTVLGMRLLLSVYSLLGRRVFNLILPLVIGYYYLTGSAIRRTSEQFLNQVKNYRQANNLQATDKLSSYAHLLSFGHTMLDKLAAWKGDIAYDQLTISGAEPFDKLVDQKQGVILLGSHLGNIELCRALSRTHTHIKINALVFTEHAERFNRVMKQVNPQSDLNLIQVKELGVDTAILLQQKIDQGEWIVIVGDRTSVSKEQRVVWAEFLGKRAPFPQGPFVLASILKAPVFLLFGLRDDNQKAPRFNVYFEHFSDKISLPRGQRDAALQRVVHQYASRLQHYTLSAPNQWYNFFNFWTLSDNKHDQQP